MTSHELARKLLTGEDLPVTVRGYEGGVDIIEYISTPEELALDANDEWYYGKHEYLSNEYEKEKHSGCKKVRAIHIG